MWESDQVGMKIHDAPALCPPIADSIRSLYLGPFSHIRGLLTICCIVVYGISMYVQVHIYIQCVYIYLFIYLFIFIYSFTCTCVYIYIYIFIYIHILICGSLSYGGHPHFGQETIAAAFACARAHTNTPRPAMSPQLRPRRCVGLGALL